MLEAIVHKYPHNHPKCSKRKYYTRVLPSVLRDSPSVFTHGDFQRKNVLVTRDDTAIMIDWEEAAWYPTFWEYAMTMYSCRWNDYWHSWVVKILEEYPNEYAWMEMVLRE